jgi:hypothetical protein
LPIFRGAQFMQGRGRPSRSERMVPTLRSQVCLMRLNG